MGLKETTLTSKIEKFWKSKGAYIIKFHGNNFTAQGVPDLIMCYEGMFLAIEVKFGNSKPRPIQLEHIRRINEWHSGKAMWVNESDWEEKSQEWINLINKKEKNGNINTR